jgi:hypothetical protein
MKSLKNTITLLALIGSGLIILDSFHVYDTLAAFIIAGVIPGTDIEIAPQQMLDIFVLAFGFMASRFVTKRLRARNSNQQELFYA